MKNKLFRICAYVSIAFFAVLIGIYICAWIFDPNSGEPPMHWRHISLGHDINLGASNVEDREWLVFYNGPYPNDTTMLGPTDTITGYEGYGIYYHVIHKSATKVTWWTLMISLWYPIILFGILPAIFAVKKLRVRRKI